MRDHRGAIQRADRRTSRLTGANSSRAACIERSRSSGDQRRPSPGCIADGVSRGLPIERYDPPREVVEDAKRIVAGAGMELGGSSTS